MMGQIDHARGRIKAIKTEKLGPEPDAPDVPSKEQLLKELLSGAITVTPAQLRRAFSEFIDRVPSERVNEISRYSYSQSRRINKYTLTNTIPESVDQALVNVVYGGQIASEIERWTEESTTYDRLKSILDARADVVEDAIVLGDNSAALLALQEFAAFDPAAALDTL